ncbi:hypothetical protein L596_001873 [Steinernema carpocapsae]|uniref:Uncharacterized protein n=1 Tax=Steinernema carpocapsae TaxID=34508 RepID=A0A4U8UN09_STECR|nr:hypothetical protein L596_001873 [Steinernema carpocapsae]
MNIAMSVQKEGLLSTSSFRVLRSREASLGRVPPAAAAANDHCVLRVDCPQAGLPPSRPMSPSEPPRIDPNVRWIFTRKCFAHDFLRVRSSISQWMTLTTTHVLSTPKAQSQNADSSEIDLTTIRLDKLRRLRPRVPTLLHPAICRHQTVRCVQSGKTGTWSSAITTKSTVTT